jgi:DNA-binding CsgD family transcriptional regulator
MLDASLNDLIGEIYDAVLDPGLWNAVVDKIRSRYNFEIAMLTAIRFNEPTPLVYASSNVPEVYERSVGGYNEDIVELWGGPEKIASLMVEEPILTTDVLDKATWPANRFYQEWAHPQGLEEQVVIALSSDETMIANLALGRHYSTLPVKEDEMKALRIIAPHLRRAVLISNLLDGATSRAETFEAALSAMTSGAVIVDRDMAILHANTVARAMIDDGDPIRDNEGHLELPVELVPGQLAAAIRSAADAEAEMGRRGMGIPTRRRDGVPLVIHVMPLKQRAARSGVKLSAVAAVFVSETGARVPLPIDAVSMLFELTPAEARVFELIALGSSIGQIAGALSVAQTTIKTHLASLYSKTDRHRRADLVRLAGELGVRT